MLSKEIKTAELNGIALDWAAAKCEGGVPSDAFAIYNTWRPTNYSIDWSQGGPIIEREGMCISRTNKTREEPWAAYIEGYYWVDGPTPLIAAMRCYVASKLGNSVSIPVQLL